ncbi:hypothetical protein K523DRAFT_334842, partial [Schizophyllum commune Tattone D]
MPNSVSMSDGSESQDSQMPYPDDFGDYGDDGTTNQLSQAQQDETGALVTTPVMNEFKIVYNRQDQVLICHHCSHVVDFIGLIGHLNRSHNVTEGEKGGTITDLTAVLNRLGVPARSASFTPDPVPRAPIMGLPISKPDKYGCTECAYTDSNKGRVADHCKRVGHGGVVSGFRTQQPRHRASAIRVQPPQRSGPALVRQIMQYHERQHMEDTLQAADDPRLVNNLLAQTKWDKMLEGKDRSRVIEQAQFPPDQDGLLARLVTGCLAYFRDNASKLDLTDELALRHVNTFEPSERGGLNHTPMRRHQDGDSTLQKYVRPAIRLLAAMLRDQHVVMPTSPDLQDALAELEHHLETSSTPSLPIFHRVFYHLWLCEWPRQVNQAYTSDPTMMYIAMAALNRDGSFMQAKDLTEVLAQFTYDIQLVVLRQMHYDIRHHSQTVHTQLWALRPLLKYVHEDEVTTFGSIRAMQHYASALAFSWRGMPSVMWKDPGRYEEMVFEGKPLPLHKLRELCHSLQASAIEIFEELSAKGQTDIPYDQLEDNLKNLTTGYTVVDYRNSEIMRERFAAFSEHLLSCDKWNLRRNVDGREVLHSRNCDQWLARLAELEERLLVLTLLASGAPPRGTEATALLLRNTPYRQRNLYLFGRQLAFVRMYNKTTHTHAHDKVIPNGFDAVTKDIAARTWFYFRPHAECFSQEVFGEEGKEIAQLYRTMMFMDYGKMFSSHALTRKMSGLTTSVLGWPMTIRKWRQIYPAIRRKHPSTSLGKPDGDDVDDVEERIEEDDPIDTRQAGHSMAIAKRLYGITADVVTGLDPDSIFVYLANSDEVQHLLRLVPGSHALPYYEATADQYPAVVRASRNQPHQSETSAQPTAGESSNGDTLTVGAATTLVESLWSKISDRLDRIEATEIRLQAQINDLHTQLAG